MTTSGTEVYGAFIEAELKIESDRRASVDGRAATFVTSSAALITLALAVFGLLGKTHQFPDVAKPFFAAAVICLLAAGACAVAAVFPRGQRCVTDRTLSTMLVHHHADPEDVARYAVASINATSLVSLRNGTKKKAVLVFASGFGQIFAMLAIGVCVWLVVLAAAPVG
jgi:hypothetical protein